MLRYLNRKLHHHRDDDALPTLTSPSDSNSLIQSPKQDKSSRKHSYEEKKHRRRSLPYLGLKDKSVRKRLFRLRHLADPSLSQSSAAKGFIDDPSIPNDIPNSSRSKHDEISCTYPHPHVHAPSDDDECCLVESPLDLVDPSLNLLASADDVKQVVTELGSCSEVRTWPVAIPYMDFIPPEVVAYILSFLPATHDLCRAAAVCWRFRVLILTHPPIRALRERHYSEACWQHGHYFPSASLTLKTHPIWQLHPSYEVTQPTTSSSSATSSEASSSKANIPPIPLERRRRNSDPSVRTSSSSLSSSPADPKAIVRSSKTSSGSTPRYKSSRDRADREKATANANGRRIEVFHYSGMDGSVQLLDLARGRVRRKLGLPEHNFPILAINKSRTRLVISCRNQREFSLEEFEFSTGKPKQTLVTHRGWITCLQFVDEDRVVSGSQDNTLALTNLVTGAREQRFIGHAGFVTCLQYVATTDAKGRPRGFLVSGSLDGTVRKWDIETGLCTMIVNCKFPVSFMHTDGHMIAAGGCTRDSRAVERGKLKLIDLSKGKVAQSWGSRLGPLAGVYVSGSRMITVESGWMSFRCRKFRKCGSIKMWDTRTGSLQCKLVDFRLRDVVNKSQCVVSFLVDQDRNIVVGLEEMEHLRPTALSHVFRIKSAIKVWSLMQHPPTRVGVPSPHPV